MKRPMFAGVTTLALFAFSPALAQGPGVGVNVGQVGVGASISFTPEQRTRIKEYVFQERVAPVFVKEEINVGAKLPAEVQLRSVPADWGPSVTKYRYIHYEDHIVFVEPTSREVVHILD